MINSFFVENSLKPPICFLTQKIILWMWSTLALNFGFFFDRFMRHLRRWLWLLLSKYVWELRYQTLLDVIDWKPFRLVVALRLGVMSCTGNRSYSAKWVNFCLLIFTECLPSINVWWLILNVYLLPISTWFRCPLCTLEYSFCQLIFMIIVESLFLWLSVEVGFCLHVVATSFIL